MDKHDEFRAEVRRNIEGLAADQDLHALSRQWIEDISPHKWAYNFRWLGRPAIQFPNDAWALQELIWAIRPDLIIETGIAHGGSLMFSASMLALLDVCDAAGAGAPLDPRHSKRRVLGIDIEIRPHNRTAIEQHPLASYIEMIEGSSIDAAIIDQARRRAAGHERIIVCLDSNHTHDHVLAELEAYAPLVTPDSYCIVLDTIVEDMPEDMFADRPWGKGDNPKTAVREWLAEHPEFEIDAAIADKLQITVAPDGFLKRLR